MRTAIYGAGAMGTSLGALLVRAGKQVDFIAHSEKRKEELNRCGAKIVGAESFCVPVKSYLPEEMSGTYDLIVLSTRQNDNPEIALFLKEYLGKDGLLLTIQNGLPEEELSEILPNVCGCTLSWGAELLETGEVKVSSTSGYHLAVGGKWDEQTRKIAEFLQDIGSVTTGNLIEIRFAKLVVNSCFSTLSAISGLTFYEIAKKYKRYALPLIKEGIAVSRAAGCRRLPLNGHDLMKVFSPAIARFTLPIAMKSYRETTSGMLKMLHGGRRTDVDFVAGALVRAGEKYGVPTPNTQRAIELVHEIENGLAEISPESISLLRNES